MDKIVKVGKFIIGGFVALIVIGLFMPSSNSTVSNPETKIQSTESGLTFGSKVRDGKYEFVVNSFKCGIFSVETYKTNIPLGQYCSANVTFTNIGNKAEYISATDQILIDINGREFDASIGSEDINFIKINPGLTTTGDIFFDVPKDITPAFIELHDSFLSAGIKVKV